MIQKPSLGSDGAADKFSLYEAIDVDVLGGEVKSVLILWFYERGLIDKIPYLLFFFPY